MKALCVLGLMQEVAAAGAGSGVGAKSWASVDVGRLERDGVDVDFYKVQVDVHASSPYLNKLTSVELCSRWTQVADAMQPERYLQVATSPIMYTNVVSFLCITVGVENCPSPKHDAQRVLVTCVQAYNVVSLRALSHHLLQAFKKPLLHALSRWAAKPFAPHNRNYILIARECT